MESQQEPIEFKKPRRGESRFEGSDWQPNPVRGTVIRAYWVCGQSDTTSLDRFQAQPRREQSVKGCRMAFSDADQIIRPTTFIMSRDNE